jgi:hypothetical protein
LHGAYEAELLGKGEKSRVSQAGGLFVFRNSAPPTFLTFGLFLVNSSEHFPAGVCIIIILQYCAWKLLDPSMSCMVSCAHAVHRTRTLSTLSHTYTHPLTLSFFFSLAGSPTHTHTSWILMKADLPLGRTCSRLTKIEERSNLQGGIVGAMAPGRRLRGKRSRNLIQETDCSCRRGEARGTGAESYSVGRAYRTERQQSLHTRAEWDD